MSGEATKFPGQPYEMHGFATGTCSCPGTSGDYMWNWVVKDLKDAVDVDVRALKVCRCIAQPNCLLKTTN
jgi:hypothetical protein